jgi:hypothetical protein
LQRDDLLGISMTKKSPQIPMDQTYYSKCAEMAAPGHYGAAIPITPCSPCAA